MKKFFDFIAGFFNSESNTSSKRLVGIVGAFTLFYTLYENSKTEGHFAPAESLVWGAVALSGVALGLTTIESITGLIKGFKGTDKSQGNGEASE
jgi:hypothetical protein